ncbi:long-chain-acyl-CoA synthetase [Comamonas testosteroni]|uniref:Long-chain-acyl-CoA synthetase n=1 Tax=Comamonas testosteroni TaxID=285 RepID=A0A373FLU9_COMTE|nr:long-chain-acyl-CoA synthetase [Comamonas testosteroni]RGE44927.1 long-chain-acyl-CoA synthetase [Comamonas testosteroni]
MSASCTISRDETQQKLDRRGPVAARYMASTPYTTADRLEECASKFGERLFLTEGDVRYTYAQFNQRANQVARALHAKGVRKGDVVAMAIENRAAFFFAWFGIAKLGAVAAFINTHVSGKPLVHALEVTHAKYVLVGEECAPRFAETQGLNTDLVYWHWPDEERPAPAGMLNPFGTDLQALAMAESAGETPKEWREGVKAGDTAQYIFTSGTTGLPKAAVISHARWLMAGDSMQLLWEVTQEDCFYCFLPLYHGAASMSLTSTALSAGGRIAVRRKFSRSEFWNDIRRYEITFCQYVGEICRFLLSVPAADNDKNHTLRKMAGTGLSPEIWQQWTGRFGDVFQIFEGWGGTESNTNTINLDNRVGSCGRVPYWEKTNLRLVRYDQEKGDYIRDENGFLQLAAVNEPGEAIGMVINYPDVVAGRFEGYTNPEASEKKLIRNVFQQGDVWWTSGDLLRCDEDGYCWFVDRIGDTFRWKSENVSTMEVSDALGDFEGLDAITVYGVQVPGHGGRAGMAALVMHEGAKFDAKAFWDLAISRLPRYAAPLFVRLMDTPDMTGNYKLRKVDLQKQGYDSAQTSDPLYVRNDKLQTYVALTAASVEEALRG